MIGRSCRVVIVCLPRTSDRRLTDSGLVLQREGMRVGEVGCVLLHPHCQETAECPVICPCHCVPAALSASTLEKNKTLVHTFSCSKIKGALSVTSNQPIMKLLSKLMRLRHAPGQQNVGPGVRAESLSYSYDFISVLFFIQFLQILSVNVFFFNYNAKLVTVYYITRKKGPATMLPGRVGATAVSLFACYFRIAPTFLFRTDTILQKKTNTYLFPSIKIYKRMKTLLARHHGTAAVRVPYVICMLCSNFIKAPGQQHPHLLKTGSAGPSRQSTRRR